MMLIERLGYRFVEVLSEPTDVRGAWVGLFEKDDILHEITDEPGSNKAPTLVVIKIGPCLEYEYQVGVELYRRCQELSEEYRIVGRTLDWVRLDDPRGESCEALMVEYLPGEPVDSLIRRTLDPDSPTYDKDHAWLFDRYVSLVQRVLEFEKLVDFTHYDLHLGNILTDDNLLSFKIIDFGHAHLEGVTGTANIHDGALGIGVMPMIHDPWYDVVRLVTSLYTYLDEGCVPHPLAGLLLDNGFNPWFPGSWDPQSGGNESPIPVWIAMKLQCYPGSELVPGMEILYALPHQIWSKGFKVDFPDASLDHPMTPWKASCDDDDRCRDFSSLMFRLKRSAMTRRLIQGGPDLLVRLFRQNLIPETSSPVAKVTDLHLDGKESPEILIHDISTLPNSDDPSALGQILAWKNLQELL